MDKATIKRISGARSAAHRAIRLDASMRRAPVVPNKKKYSRKAKHPKKGAE